MDSILALVIISLGIPQCCLTSGYRQVSFRPASAGYLVDFHRLFEGPTDDTSIETLKKRFAHVVIPEDIRMFREAAEKAEIFDKRGLKRAGMQKRPGGSQQQIREWPANWRSLSRAINRIIERVATSSREQTKRYLHPMLYYAQAGPSAETRKREYSYLTLDRRSAADKRLDNQLALLHWFGRGHGIPVSSEQLKRAWHPFVEDHEWDSVIPGSAAPRFQPEDEYQREAYMKAALEKLIG